MNIPEEYLTGWFPNANRCIYAESSPDAYNRRGAGIVVSKLRSVLRQKGSAVFVPSAGKSPRGIYAVLRRDYLHAVDWSRVTVVQMDEYWKIPDTDPSSFAYFLRKELVDPLGIGTFIHFFDDTGNPVRDLSSYEAAVTDLGGIDLVLHGIGGNGHIGFNEPGTSWTSETRKVVLAPSTVAANFAEGETRYAEGVTLGLRMLTGARHVLLAVCGENKRAIIRLLLTHEPTADIPASSISENPVVDCVIDGASVLA